MGRMYEVTISAPPGGEITEIGRDSITCRDAVLSQALRRALQAGHVPCLVPTLAECLVEHFGWRDELSELEESLASAAEKYLADLKAQREGNK